MYNVSSLVFQSVKNLPPMQETPVQFLGQEDPLEKEMAMHSSIIAWRIPRTEEPGRIQSIGSQETDTPQQLNHHHLYIILCNIFVVYISYIYNFIFLICYLRNYEHIPRSQNSFFYTITLKSTLGFNCMQLPHFFLFFILFYFFYQLEANYFTILQWVFSYIEMNQPWIPHFTVESFLGFVL